MPKGFMYMLAIMDLYSRYIVGWSLSNTMEAGWVVDFLRLTIHLHGKSGIINSDQGSQFTPDEYVVYVKRLETVSISMDEKGRVKDNAFVERFFRIIKYEKIYLENPETVQELHQLYEQLITYYNERRDHFSIGKLPPVFM